MNAGQVLETWGCKETSNDTGLCVTVACFVQLPLQSTETEIKQERMIRCNVV